MMEQEPDERTKISALAPLVAGNPNDGADGPPSGDGDHDHGRRGSVPNFAPYANQYNGCACPSLYP
jgi:hypothetical protein